MMPLAEGLERSTATNEEPGKILCAESDLSEKPLVSLMELRSLEPAGGLRGEAGRPL